MPDDPKTYEIRTVADFFAVPADKRQHCLQDFALWMRSMEAGVEAINKSLAGIGLVVADKRPVSLDR